MWNRLALWYVSVKENTEQMRRSLAVVKANRPIGDRNPRKEKSLVIQVRSRNNSVSTGNGIRAGRPGFNCRQGQLWNFFYHPSSQDRLWGPFSLLSNSYRESFPRGRAGVGREADPSPSSTAEVTLRGVTPPPIRIHVIVIKQWICLHGVVLS